MTSATAGRGTIGLGIYGALHSCALGLVLLGIVAAAAVAYSGAGLRPPRQRGTAS